MECPSASFVDLCCTNDGMLKMKLIINACSRLLLNVVSISLYAGRGQTLSPHLCKMQPMWQTVHGRRRDVPARYVSAFVPRSWGFAFTSGESNRLCMYLHRISCLAPSLQEEQQGWGQLQGRMFACHIQNKEMISTVNSGIAIHWRRQDHFIT